MAKILSGFSVVTTSVGKRVAYTYSEIDEEGMVIKSNVKESFIALDKETKELIKNLEEKIDLKLQRA